MYSTGRYPSNLVQSLGQLKTEAASATNTDRSLTIDLTTQERPLMHKSNTSPRSLHPRTSTSGLIATIATAGTFLDYGRSGEVVLSDPTALEDYIYYPITDAINKEVERQQADLLAALADSDVFLREIEDAWMKTMPYADYLQTPHWCQIREYALDNANRRCQVCNSPDRLQVHHRTYERRGREAPGDLTVLCSSCHSTFHKNRKLHRETK